MLPPRPITDEWNESVFKSTTPIIIDVEASGFGQGSYPIEIGIALADGSRHCFLVAPARSWKHWDTEAEKVHGISRELLSSHGRPIQDIAWRLNELLRTRTVYSDAWSFDIFSQVGRAVAETPGQLLGDLEPTAVIAAGESQSAGYLTTLVNAVHPLDPVFDGFLVHSRGANAAPLDGEYLSARDVESVEELTERSVLIRTDLEDWQPYTAGEEPTQMGAATITVTEDDITISYPSGTWAFP